MKVEFRKVKAGGSEFKFSALPADLDLEADGFKFPELIDVELNATRAGDEIVIQGNISAFFEAECGRCLEPYERTFSSRLQFVIQFLDVNGPEDSGDEDFVVLPKTAQDYDISERVREAIILELPLKPLCSDGCRGLCPMCGENLNEADCGCTQDKTDERWNTLRQLFED